MAAPRPQSHVPPTGLAPYREAVAYLETYIRGTTEAPLDRDATGRERMAAMRRLMAALGDPHLAYRTVHVTGTAGKGSTSALMAGVLQAAGHRTGLHTTPYLQEAVEKVQVEGRPIAADTLASVIADLRTLLTARPDLAAEATFVHLWTAVTFEALRRYDVEVAVIEASAGGRYDATNVVQPEVAVITNVGHDHLTFLGPTLADVAYHKAGIIKPGVPAVTAALHPDALPVMEREAAMAGAPLWRLNHEIRLQVHTVDATGSRFAVDTPAASHPDLHTGMLGPHQAVNAALAVAACDLLAVRGIAIPDEALRQGIATARFPGRFELVQQTPTVVLDGAHNPEKAESLAAALRAVYPGRQVTFVLGVGASKDLPGVLQHLLPLADHVVCTEASATAKPAVTAATLAAAVRTAGISAAAEPDPHAAVAAGIERTGGDGIVCVTGSLYLVGAVRGRWHPTAELFANAAPASSPGRTQP